MDDLVLIPVHTKPEDSLKELDELHDVVEDIRKKWKTDVSFMFWLKNSDQFSCICIEPIQHNSCFKGCYSKLKENAWWPTPPCLSPSLLVSQFVSAIKRGFGLFQISNTAPGQVLLVIILTTYLIARLSSWLCSLVCDTYDHEITWDLLPFRIFVEYSWIFSLTAEIFKLKYYNIFLKLNNYF